MADYKEFTGKELVIYEKEIKKLKKLQKEGKSLDELSAKINVKEKGLKEIILDDFIKIVIADLHFNKRLSLEEVSKILKTKIERIETAQKEMFEDVMHSINKSKNIDTIKKGYYNA